jgi:hypothetical protein
VHYLVLNQAGQENQDKLKLNTTHQLLVYADNINLLDENINTKKKITEALLVTGNEAGQEVNVQETMCSCLL